MKGEGEVGHRLGHSNLIDFRWWKYFTTQGHQQDWAWEEVLQAAEGAAESKVVSVVCVTCQAHTLTWAVLRRRKGTEVHGHLDGVDCIS